MRTITAGNFLALLLLANIALAQNSAPPSGKLATTINANLSLFQTTWQCNGCNLTHVNLSYFSTQAAKKPASAIDCSAELTLAQADLSYATLTNSNFTACARGTTTLFSKIDFSYANLSHAQLTQSVFYSVSFRHTNLAEAELNGIQLNLSDFTQANFSHAHLNQATSTRDAMHGWGSNFYLANFCGADLSQANLYGYFRGANFSLAKLNHTILTTSEETRPSTITHLRQLKGASLWSGVNFKDADLTGAHFYDENDQPADLSQASFCRTIMPDGTTNNRDCHQD